jgi:hypothetical protein
VFSGYPRANARIFKNAVRLWAEAGIPSGWSPHPPGRPRSAENQIWPDQLGLVVVDSGIGYAVESAYKDVLWP